MYILASKSPRRKVLMAAISQDFLIDVSDIDESTSLPLGPEKAVVDIAKRKCIAVAARHPDDIVIAADTIVVIDNTIIGKPADKLDAIRILKLLSNRTHVVITAYSIKEKDKHITKSVFSEVTFNYLSDELIKEYVDYGSCMDKAGAYGVQDNEKYHLIAEVKGDINNVIGFPVDDIKKTLKDYFL